MIFWAEPSALRRSGSGRSRSAVLPGSAASGAHQSWARKPAAWTASTNAFMSASPRGYFAGVGVQSPSATCQPSSRVTQPKPSLFTTGRLARTWSVVNVRP